MEEYGRILLEALLEYRNEVFLKFVRLNEGDRNMYIDCKWPEQHSRALWLINRQICYI